MTTRRMKSGFILFLAVIWSIVLPSLLQGQESPDSLVIYRNSFETSEDTIGWVGLHSNMLVEDPAPGQGSHSLLIGGGCIQPAAWIDVPCSAGDVMYRLSFWGNTGNVEMDGGWIILGPAYRGIWDQDNFGIYANSSDWTFYQAEKDLHLGEVDSLRIQIMVGGIRYDDVQIDGLEVVAYPLLGSQSVTEVPTAFCLGPAFPNPFNPATTIHFNLPISTNVRLMVYDLLGREVVRLVEGYMEPGYHQVRWDGRNASGGELTSGIYVARLITPEYSTSIKMVLMK